MSQIGTFSLCPKGAWKDLVRLVSGGQTETARGAIEKIQAALVPASAPGEEACSGIVFTALFAYCQSALGADLWGEDKDAQALWRETTGDYVVLAFPAEAREELLALTEAVSPAELEAFVNDFFQMDCGGAGRAALERFRRGLQVQDRKSVV